MTKDEMANVIVTRTGCTKADAECAVEELFSQLANEAALVGLVRLPGLGSLERVHRAAAPGRNPRTGETIQVAAHYALKFRPGIAIKRRLAAIVPLAQAAE